MKTRGMPQRITEADIAEVLEAKGYVYPFRKAEQTRRPVCAVQTGGRYWDCYCREKFGRANCGMHHDRMTVEQVDGAKKLLPGRR